MRMRTTKKNSDQLRDEKNIEVSSFVPEDSMDDDSSIGTSFNESSDTNHQGNTSSPSDDAQIAKKETSAVKGLKLLVLAVLVASMVTITVGVYMFSSNAEQQDFEDAIADYTVKIFASLGENIDLMLGAIDTFVVTIVSLAKATNQTWPFVTIPDFAVRGAKIRSLSGATYLNLYQYVSNENRAAWEAYTAIHGPQWVHESIDIQEDDENYKGPIIRDYENWNVIHHNDEYDKEFPGVNGTDANEPYYLPTWQAVPVIPRYPAYNWDLLDDPSTDTSIFNTSRVSITPAYLIYVEGNDAQNELNEIDADWFKDYILPGEEPMEPVSDIFYPILANAADHVSTRKKTDNNNVVAILALSVYWRNELKNILPTGANGVDVVFENPCSPTFTYRLNGPTAVYRGSGDVHDMEYSGMGTSAKLLELRDHAFGSGRAYTGVPIAQDRCPFTVTVYPSAVMHDYYTTSTPMMFTIAALIIFLFTSAVFVFYDIMVERRQKLVLSTATKTSAIVSSLFPFKVRAELMKEQDELERERERATALEESPKRKLKKFLVDNDENSGRGLPASLPMGSGHASKPLAELYADTTVFFGDIAGFTAWSSSRDPIQVFTLLETLYGEFDAVARRRGVFKVETIGDSYVAVCGLPEPRKRHAVVMAKFAADCRRRTNQICQELELSLGPGTADLKLRIGLHSGPVTAGVLRGDKSRFQLFGDTVNTAARMESLSIKDRIQVSQKTADLIVAGRKGHWLTPRDTLVDAKGKGKMQTYWLELKMSPDYSESEGATEGSLSHVDFEAAEGNTDLDNVHPLKAERYMRLVEWNTAMFEELLKQVVVYHQTTTTVGDGVKNTPHKMNPMPMGTNGQSSSATMVREEVVEILNLPEFDSKNAAMGSVDHHDIEVNDNVKSQLRSFILAIANTYRPNPFHNFEHASHVVMATKKLLQRVATPDIKSQSVQKKDLHQYTYGITSDPLTQFALATAALIHDLDHQGVSNGQLVKEQDPVAIKYQNKSVAEQNSFEISWNMFMDPCYIELRKSLCPSNDELKRFRLTVLNSVMATDIFDKELKALRDSRWEKAFHQGGTADTRASFDKQQKETDAVSTNRKATIVIEHIIQASDVAHTMQHWTVYQKWNRHLFREMYSAYLTGRGGDNDPSQGWYNGELWFFDNYVIPLAHRLKECGVFGASYAELLDFARDNRLEWENKGHAIVAEMVEELSQVAKPNGGFVLKEKADETKPKEGPAGPFARVEEDYTESSFISI